jgi:hypothetical protein
MLQLLSFYHFQTTSHSLASLVLEASLRLSTSVVFFPLGKNLPLSHYIFSSPTHKAHLPTKSNHFLSVARAAGHHHRD